MQNKWILQFINYGTQHSEVEITEHHTLLLNVGRYISDHIVAHVNSIAQHHPSGGFIGGAEVLRDGETHNTHQSTPPILIPLREGISAFRICSDSDFP